MEELLKIVSDNWMAGNFMTPKTSFHGSQLVSPSVVHYTKPIIVLIDELSGSGGDAFPSMMKGFGRATLLGTRTMGAGGHVVELPGLNNSQLMVRMTKSLFFRPDGVAVENNGAVPDIDYAITRDDYVYGYKLYREFYTQKLLDLVH